MLMRTCFELFLAAEGAIRIAASRMHHILTSINSISRCAGHQKVFSQEAGPPL